MDHPHEGFDKDNAFFGRNFIGTKFTEILLYIQIFTFSDLDPAHDAGDPHGHGTHVGGTIGSYNYGVAKVTLTLGL